MALVLLVEDDAAIAEAVRQSLVGEGYDVLHAWNGREAMDALAAQPHPDVILLDLMMPVMTGWQVMEELTQEQGLSEIPVIVTSATSSAEEHPQRDFLKKPYSLTTLLSLVEKHASNSVDAMPVRATG